MDLKEKKEWKVIENLPYMVSTYGRVKAINPRYSKGYSKYKKTKINKDNNTLDKIKTCFNDFCNCCVYNNREEEDFPCDVCEYNGNADIFYSEYENYYIKIRKRKKFIATVKVKGIEYNIRKICFDKSGELVSITTFNKKIEGEALEDVEIEIIKKL